MLLQRNPRVDENAIGPKAVPTRAALAQDLLEGFGATPKRLPSRWFYDDEGSRLFQQIMAMPEYYLTRTEHDILRNNAAEIAEWIVPDSGPLHLVELGSGDGEKTLSLCRTLLAMDVPCTFHPIDVSEHALSALEKRFRAQLPDLKVAPVLGSYDERWPGLPPAQRQVVLLLGSSLGNLAQPQAVALLEHIRAHMRPDDVLLLGLDLKKDPHAILAAYNDAGGITAAFNLNLLRRLNRELGMNFDLAQFRHFPTYSPLDGAARSFLVSLKRQTVHSDVLSRDFTFQSGEAIYTEQSQKYTLGMIDELAQAADFDVRSHVTDDLGWYTIAVLQARAESRGSASAGDHRSLGRKVAIT